MSTKLNILIASHSKTQQNGQILIDAINEKKRLNSFVCILANETTPEKLSTRSSLILNCDAFVLITSIDFQKCTQLMELAYFANEVKAKIFAINFFSPYKPFGALGVICASTQHGVIQLHNETYFQDGLNKFLDALANLQGKNSNEFTDRPVTAIVNLIDLNQTSDVLITFHSNQKEIANIINSGLRSLNCLMEDATESKTSVKKTKVLIAVLSSDYEGSYSCRAVVESARMLKIPIIPINPTNGVFKPTSWLGLVIAGKIFHRIFSRDQAFTKAYDSTPMNDLKIAVTIALEPVVTLDENEKGHIKLIEKKIEDCKKKLASWPPPSRHRDYIEEKAVKIDVTEPKAMNQFNQTHFSLERAEFVIPKELFDKNGVPLRHKFDCMISYEWNTYNLVRLIYMQLHMNNHSDSIWFDIWGNAMGNCYDSMAAAIENSKVILVVLNEKYQKSENCKLEFNYAVYRGKPFIFIIVEPKLAIADWLQSYYNDWPKFEVSSVDDLKKLHNSVPRLLVILHAIREIGAAQVENLKFDLSDKLIELRGLLDDALDEIALQTNQSRYKICTRCNRQFDETNMSGCKKHTAYYLADSTLQGRWICCSQQNKDSNGCGDVDHIEIERIWKLDAEYGTYSWEPP